MVRFDTVNQGQSGRAEQSLVDANRVELRWTLGKAHENHDLVLQQARLPLYVSG
ncbi:MAG: hypothetical protein IT425_10295 [Pirellulales bacterium]|nr:hypothetical protein [Pirellulales bacterium]